MIVPFLVLLLACPTDAPEATLAPPPGEGAANPPGEGGVAPPPSDQPEPKLVVAEGEGVKLSGTATYEGEIASPIRLDVLLQGEGGPQRTHTVLLEKMGAFEVVVPKNYGSVQLAVLLETSAPARPMAVTPWIDVLDQPIADIALVLAPLDPTAGPAVAPTGPPPEGTAPPPDGAAPPPAGEPPPGALGVQPASPPPG